MATAENVASFTIYHIPGKKVGCTSRLQKRQKTYPPGTPFEILEIFHGTAEAAGFREWEWADHFGYPRGGFYPNNWDAHLTQEQKVHFGTKGGRALAMQGRKWGPQSEEHRRKIGDPQRGVPRQKHTDEWKQNNSKKLTGLTAWVVNENGPIKVFTKDLQTYLNNGYRRGRK